MTSFSIVTIVYNDVAHIKETMDSVINQSYKNIEYILIDGGSNDGTKEVILDYIHSCANITKNENGDTRYYLEATHSECPTLTFKFLSEKDKGIYDAMNKGITLATREWINFMNCGDRFYNINALEKVSSLKISDYDIVYGDTAIDFIDCKSQIIRYSHDDLNNLCRLFSGFNHQSFFIKTNLHKELRYNLHYRFASDYDFVYKCFKNHKKFLHISQIIAIFSAGGSSDTRAFDSLKEALLVALSYNSSILQKIKIYLHMSFAVAKKSIKLYLSPNILKHILRLFPR